MRRTVIGFASTVSAVVLLFSYRTSLGADTTAVAQSGVHSTPAAGASPTTAPPTTAVPGTSTPPWTVTGTAVSTRYGPVQVQLTVSGTTITAATAISYPTGDRRSAQINTSAVPVLEQETVAAQSATVDAVSGASYTSQGYVQSLQSAIDQIRA